jgi:uncharacterized protein
MRSIGFCTVVVAVAGIAARPLPVFANDRLALYQAMAIVTGTDLRERPRGFAECLKDVLVKVSGDARLRPDPRVAALAAHANEYVASFSYVDPIAGTRPKDDQGTYDRSENLTVSFDPPKIDELLTSLGDPPWHGPRPVLVPVLSVHGRKPPAWLLSASEPLAAEQRNSFERIASEAGVAVRFASRSEFQKFRVRKDATPDTAPCGPDATIVVLGHLSWSETAPGWVGTWHTCWQGREHTWSVRGGGYDLAFANIVQGATLLASGHGVPTTLPAPTP